MINVSELLSDPDFAQQFTINRTSGAFALGGFVETPLAPITVAGVVNLSAGNALLQEPSGDRVEGKATFYSPVPLYESRNGSAIGVSDTISWNGATYRLAQVWDRSANGFFKAVGVRTSGE